jgi:hypothetical protein
MSMTHHNQTKVLITWFLNLPVDESIDNKKHKVWIMNRRPHEAQLQTKSQWKAQEGHLEAGKAAKPTKGTQSGKPNQNGKWEPRKAQYQKLPLNQLPLTLNASSPLR